MSRDLLGIGELVAERERFMRTIVELSDAEFEHGRTLCAGWAPRDVLAHVMGVSHPAGYLRGGLRMNAVNAAVVRAARPLPRGELTARGHTWAAHPNATDRMSAWLLLGDLGVHHQDVLRGLGRTRTIPPPVAAAIFREGVLLSTGTSRTLLRNRVEPTTVGGRSLGRGRRVRGTTEALGLWLAGRQGLDDELEFSPARP
jgi:uncharacterized protein (TIGR03083 family)